MSTYDLIVILGPTASGKTALAVDLAQFLDAEIISADSRQVYIGMDIGTGKDLDEYQNIPHHLINIREAGEKYNVADFQKDFWQAYNAIRKKNKAVILCGGTGMYIDAVLQNYNHTQVPENQKLRQELEVLDHKTLQALALQNKLPANTDLSTHKRTVRALEIAAYSVENVLKDNTHPTLRPFVIGINPPLETRRENIAQRLRQRLQQGLIEEVNHLLQQGVLMETLLYYGLEYKHVCQYLQESWTLQMLEERLCIAIQQYAKRQMTYFRSMERKGLTIHWLDF